MDEQHLNGAEPVIEPDLPIIDPHHHLWFAPEAAMTALEARGDEAGGLLSAMFRNRPRYLFEDLLADTSSGHNIRATVFIDAHAMYRADGPPELRSVGEVEFVNGAAAMAASGVFSETRHCAGIVGGADLSLGDGARAVLEAHVQAGGGRYRGVRNGVHYDGRAGSLSTVLGNQPHVLMNPIFRAGFRHLGELALSCDVSVALSQLGELIDLAWAFPGTTIILNHLGAPVDAMARDWASPAAFAHWREEMRKVADCPNIVVKLGGLGNPISGLPLAAAPSPASSETLAALWRPYIETCIEIFDSDRCMFESNFPVDGQTANYRVVWNAFKRIVSGASAAEKAALFFDTARRVYRLEM